MNTKYGTLYVVATPIGNLDDFSVRAQNILNSVHKILAEDKRNSKKLLMHYNISTPMETYHDHNKERVTQRYINMLKDGVDLALISDAGTPGVADPAFYIVRESVKEEIPVSPIPGASAVISALVCSGLPTDRFTFDNFFPIKSGKKEKLLKEAQAQGRTVICYESPYRIKKTLKQMNEVLGDISVVIAREISKLHEEFLRGTPKELLNHFENITPKGEFVVLFNCSVKNKKD